MQPRDTSRPSLTIVTGRPGAGKTTLVRALTASIRCPAISRDEIKEGFVTTVGKLDEAGDDITQAVFDTFFETIGLLLNRRISLIAEAAFQHRVWAPRLEPLREIACVRIIICTIPTDLAITRRIARLTADPDRKRFHPDPLVDTASANANAIASYDAPRIDVPTLTVDTSNGYAPDLQTIISYIRA